MRTDDVGYHHIHDGRFHIHKPKGSGDWLLLLLKTPAVFRIGKEETETEAGSFIIFTADFPQEYRASGEIYTDDWLHFEPDAEEKVLIETLGIPLNKPVYIGSLAAASDIIKRICFDFYSAHEYRLETSSLYFRLLLYKLSEQMHRSYNDLVLCSTAYDDKLIWIRSSIYRWPEQNWNADILAKELSLSMSHFHRLYTATFGSTMLQDITNSRMRKARTLLETTELSLTQISEQCGYGSASYFIRLFSRSVGLTPLQYRKNKTKHK